MKTIINGILVADEKLGAGTITYVEVERIIKALVKSGEVTLFDHEKIDGIMFDIHPTNAGVYLRIGKK